MDRQTFYFYRCKLSVVVAVRTNMVRKLIMIMLMMMLVMAMMLMMLVMRNGGEGHLKQ